MKKLKQGNIAKAVHSNSMTIENTHYDGQAEGHSNNNNYYIADQQPLNDTLSLENDPIFDPTSDKQYQYQQHQNQHPQLNVNFFDKINNKITKIEKQFILEDDNQIDSDQSSQDFDQQMILGCIPGVGGNNPVSKDFAGETFSQISSTFEQQVSTAGIVTPVGTYSQNIQSKQIASQKSNINKSSVGQNNINTSNLPQVTFPQMIIDNKQNELQKYNDELLDFEILNKSSQQSPTTGQAAQVNFDNHLASKNNQIYSNNKINNTHSKLISAMSQNQHQYSQNNNNQSSINYYQNSAVFDEASILKILDQSLSGDDGTGSEKFGLNNQNSNLIFENLINDGKDLISFIQQIQQISQQLNSASNSSNKSQTQLLNELANQALKKAQSIQKQGIKMAQRPSKEFKMQLRENVRKQLQKYKELCKKQFQKAEDQRFKFVINEYELNSRVSQLEEAFAKQQDEINIHANKNEQLKYEKKVNSYKYEKQLSKIEDLLQCIMKEQKQSSHNPKVTDKLKRINNSFCVEATNQSLIQNETKSYLAKKKPFIHIDQEDSEKENESFLSNKFLQREGSERGNSAVNNLPSQKKTAHHQKFQKHSLQSQLVNLHQLIQNFKEKDIQQQESGSYYQKSNNSDNSGYLKNVINMNNYHHDQLTQQSQQIRPEQSEASVNQAFIESIQSSSKNDGCENQSTSFFGKDFLMNEESSINPTLLPTNNNSEVKNNNKAILSYIISARGGFNADEPLQQSSTHSYEQDTVQKMFYNRLKDLSITQQERLIQQLWGNGKSARNFDGVFHQESRDVKIEDLLEISKKTIGSGLSSFRTLNGASNDIINQGQILNKQMSRLKVMKGVSNILPLEEELKQQMERKYNDKNNSTLEISFNHNEIKVLNGNYSDGISEDGDQEDSPFHSQPQKNKFNHQGGVDADQSLQNYFNLDEKISENDLHHGNRLSASKKLKNTQRQNILQHHFLSSLESDELQIGGLKNNIRGPHQQNSVDDVIQILGDLHGSNKFTHINDGQKMMSNFTDLSLIEGNKSQKFQMTGETIPKNEDCSLYSGAGSLIDMDLAFIPPRSNVVQELITIKGFNKEILMPKLDIERVVALENRETFKKNIVWNDESSISAGPSVEPGSFQNETLNKNIITNISNSESKSDLDKAIYVNTENPQQEDFNNESCDNYDNNDLQDMFGEFKNQLENEHKKAEQVLNKEDNEDDTLDFNDLPEAFQQQQQSEDFNFDQSQSDKEILLAQYECSKEAIKPVLPQKLDKKVLDYPVRQENSNLGSFRSISHDLSHGLSLHQKSQSESKLLLINEANQKLTKNNEPENSIHLKEIVSNIKLTQNKVKTPKNSIKLNFGTNNIGVKQNNNGDPRIRFLQPQTKNKNQNPSIQDSNIQEAQISQNSPQKVQILPNKLDINFKQQSLDKNMKLEFITHQQENNQVANEQTQLQPPVKKLNLFKGQVLNVQKFKQQNQSMNAINPADRLANEHKAKVQAGNFSILSSKNNNINATVVHEQKFENDKSCNEDNQSHEIVTNQKQIQNQKKFKSLMNVVKKQTLIAHGSPLLNNQIDESNLVSNYFSAAAIASKQKPTPNSVSNVNKTAVGLIQKGIIFKKSPGFKNQISLDNINKVKVTSFNTQDQINANLQFSGEYKISQAQISECQLSGTGSISPPQSKTRQGNSVSSGSPGKKITIVSKQLIKLNPTSQNAMKGLSFNPRRISISKRQADYLNDPSPGIQNLDLVNQTEVIQNNNYRSLPHNIKNIFDHHNKSHILSNQNPNDESSINDSSLINAQPISQLARHSIISADRKQQNVKMQNQSVASANASDISINLEGAGGVGLSSYNQQPQQIKSQISLKSNPKIQIKITNKNQLALQKFAQDHQLQQHQQNKSIQQQSNNISVNPISTSDAPYSILQGDNMILTPSAKQKDIFPLRNEEQPKKDTDGLMAGVKNSQKPKRLNNPGNNLAQNNVQSNIVSGNFGIAKNRIQSIMVSSSTSVTTAMTNKHNTNGSHNKQQFEIAQRRTRQKTAQVEAADSLSSVISSSSQALNDREY